MNKKIITIILFLFASFFTLSYDVNADYNATVVSVSKCPLKSNASGSCIYKDTKFNSYVSGPIWVDIGDKLRVITSKSEVKAPSSGTGSECKSNYVYISIDFASETYHGYVCKDNLWDGSISNELKKEFTTAGFPESYWNSLAALRMAHPKWKFVAVNTKLDFETAVNNEDSGSKSLIQYTNSVNALGYLSTSEVNYNWTTDKYKAYAGRNWYAANSETIAYYMDPRNFLTDIYIFQFEPLYYNKDTQTLDVVQSILRDAYISRFASNFMTAGAKANVSPVYLASLSRQEMGTSANTAISGKAITYNGKSYSGYNFFNIGATPTNDKNVVDGLDAYRGIVYAAGGNNKSDTSYSRPWNTEAKAIEGGAKWIYDNYVGPGQMTSYFKKWNTVYHYALDTGGKPHSLYSHQYMQNIQAPSSEAKSVYNSYTAEKRIDLGYVFYIPVYNNMPASTSLPNKNSPNNYLKALTLNINGAGAKGVSGFSGDTLKYTVNVDNDKSTVVIGATSVRSDAKITGTGTKTLKVGTNTFSIVVTAANGSKRTYEITINRAGATGDYKTIEQIITDTKLNIDSNYITGLSFTTKASGFETLVTASEPKSKVVVKRGNTTITTGNVITGDTVTITSGDETKTYTVILYGDINKDGKISILDLLAEQKHLLGTNKLTGTTAKAADVNKDGKISILDLLAVQKHLLGYSLITQK